MLPSGVNDVDYSGAYEDLSVNDVTVASDITSSASTSSINGITDFFLKFHFIFYVNK